MESKNSRIGRLYIQLDRLGININDIDALIKIERTLNAWHAEECNGTIERDDNNGKAFRVYSNAVGYRTYHATADRETAAIKRLEKIMAQYPALTHRLQGDPRGCALYINNVAVCF